MKKKYKTNTAFFALMFNGAIIIFMDRFLDFGVTDLYGSVHNCSIHELQTNNSNYQIFNATIDGQV